MSSKLIPFRVPSRAAGLGDGSRSELSSVAIVGLGYVGLPTAAALHGECAQIIGIDVNEQRLAEIAALGADLGELDRLPGNRDGQHQSPDQVGGQQRLDHRELEMVDGPGHEQVARYHAADAEQPPGLAQQVGQDAQAQEPRLRLLLSGVLLQDEPDPEQYGSQEGRRIVHIQVHGALSSCFVGAKVCGYHSQRALPAASFDSSA